MSRKVVKQQKNIEELVPASLVSAITLNKSCKDLQKIADEMAKSDNPRYVEMALDILGSISSIKTTETFLNNISAYFA